MIRRFTSAQFVPANAGSKDKNPMGSTLLSTPIIALTNLDRHQILRNFCHDSVRKGLKSNRYPLQNSNFPQNSSAQQYNVLTPRATEHSRLVRGPCRAVLMRSGWFGSTGSGSGNASRKGRCHNDDGPGGAACMEQHDGWMDAEAELVY